jgi:hypothetical protein
VLILGVAPFALYRNRSLPLLLLSLALHLSVSFDTYIIFNTGTQDRYFYATMPLAAAIIGYLAFAPRPLPASEPAPMPAEAAGSTPGRRSRPGVSM